MQILHYVHFISGAFLIPYLICVIVGGIPLFYLEVAVGQFMGVAGVKAWNLVPIFRGKDQPNSVKTFTLESPILLFNI